MIKKILVVLFILACIIFYARTEYTWANRIQGKYTENWTVVSTKKAFSTLFKPWSWFKRPIGTIIFVENNGFGKLNSQFYYAHTLTFKKGEEFIKNIKVVDVVNKQFTSINTNEEFKELDEMKLENLFWIDYKKESVIFDLSEFLKSKVKTYFAVDPLGQEIDITNYISSGLYDIANNKGQFITELINQNPYSPSDSDLEQLKLELNKWIIENDYEEFEVKSISDNEIHYLHSKMFYTMTDIFQYELRIVNTRIDTSINIEFTFLHLYYPEKKGGNDIIIF